MGNVMAASAPPPPPPIVPLTPPELPKDHQISTSSLSDNLIKLNNPGTVEELHKLCKG